MQQMMQQQLRLQDVACLAAHQSNIHEEDEAPVALQAPAQRMPKILHAHSLCAHIDSLYTHDCAHTHTLHTTPHGNLYTHNHPYYASCIASHCDKSLTLSPYTVDDFTPLGTLGRGNMGTVILVLSKHSPCTPFALKITHPLSSKKQRSNVEKEILSSLHHPFLQTLHAHFDSGNHSLLLLDFCSGGDLNLLRHRQPEKRFSETAARFYAAEVLVALEHLHKLGIVYRDLKPENILVQESGHIKLTDFDLSLKLSAERKAPAHATVRPPICSLQQQLEAEADAALHATARPPICSLQQQLEAEADASPHATVRPPLCSLQQQLEAEAEVHLQLQAGKKRLHCALRGYTSRKIEGLSNQKIEGKGCGCWITREGGERCFSRRKEGAKQRCVCGKRCVCGRRGGDRKKGAYQGSLSRRNKYVGGQEARKVRKSTKSELRMSWLPCFKGKERIDAEERSVYVVGTDEYVAPEVLRGEEHGFSMDWWSFGILLYEMIYGHTPFKGATTEETLCNILEKMPQFPGMKSPAKDLITQLLVKDPGARLGATGAQIIKRHPFFHGLHWESLPHICRPPFIPSPLCLSELEERYSAKLKAKRDAQSEHRLSNTCKSWLDEVVDSMEAAENSSQYSHTSSSAGFMSSSADGADQELRRDDDADTVFSSAEWSSELDVCVYHAPP